MLRRKGNYEVNFCISFCLLPLFLPKNNLRTLFHINDPLSSPKHDISSPGHRHKYTDELKISPCEDVYTLTHVWTGKESEAQRQSPCKDTVHLSAVAVIPRLSNSFFLGGEEKGKKVKYVVCKNGLFPPPLPQLCVQTPFPGW